MYLLQAASVIRLSGKATGHIVGWESMPFFEDSAHI
jgi:hypothetical protein